MKFSQQVALYYYTQKLRMLEKISPRKAAEVAFNIFCTPYTKRRKYISPPIFEQAEKLNFIFNNQQVYGFYWKPPQHNGRKILICHGFDSYSYKFEKYIQPLLQKGFEVLAFDAPAHGLSQGKTINAAQYRDTVIEIIQRFGPIDGVMAHSLGGLAVALAAEQLPQHTLQRLVLIAPATESTRAIQNFFTYIKVSPEVKAEFGKIIFEKGGYPAEWYSVSRVMQQQKIATLWVHDEGDTITPFSDVKHLLDQNHGHLRFHITKGLGHSNVYRDELVIEKIIAFLSQLKPANKTIEPNPAG